MTKAQLQKLIGLAFRNGLDPHIIAVAFHIAAYECNNPEYIVAYGTAATDSLRELCHDLEEPPSVVEALSE